jgi:hypothetical protein
MEDDAAVAGARAAAAESLPSGLGRHDRPQLVAFVEDAATETVLIESLAEAANGPLDVRRGGVKAAINTLRKSPTPRVLIVDVSGAEQPLTALHDLSFVTEPDVRVLVIGEIDNLDFYREVTRGLGALEYLSKPLTRDMIARHFAPVGGWAGPDPGVGAGWPRAGRYRRARRRGSDHDRSQSRLAFRRRRRPAHGSARS